MIDPRAEYSRRIEKHRRIVASREGAHRRLGNAKLLVVIAAFAAAWFSLVRHSFSPYWLLALIVVYAALDVWHERVLRSKNRSDSAAAFYERGIARIEDRWAGTGQSGERFRDPKHDYSDDLDLFGPASLFELLCSARLPMGENFLARWLCSPSLPGTVADRQKLVAELRPALDLRETLAVIGSELRARINPESLVHWSQGQPVRPFTSVGLRAVFAVLSILAVVSLVYSLATVVLWPLVAVLIVESLVFGWLHRRAENFVAQISANAEGLQLFSRLLAQIAKEHFESP